MRPMTSNLLPKQSITRQDPYCSFHGPGRTNAFMRDLLAPLVTGDTPEYQTLRNDIFGEHTGLA